MKQTIKVGRLFRSATIDRAATVPAGITRMSFSSEDPYERYFGYEILDHSDGAMDMSRLLNKAPVLAEHDPEKQIGVVESAYIDGGRGYADFRWGHSALAQEYKADVEDGIRSHVSVGYMVDEMKLLKKGTDGPDSYLVSRWTPLEVSLVSIAADDGVGIGRSDESEIMVREFVFDYDEPKQIEQEEVKDMSDKENTPVVEVTKDNAPTERQRQKDIRDASKFISDVPGVRDLADQFCDNGKSVGEFLAAARDLRGIAEPINSTPELGLTKKESGQFSIVRAAMACKNNDWSRAGFEKEVSDAVADKMGRSARGFFVPDDVFRRDILTTGTGDELVATDHMASAFIELLRNRSVLIQAGARTLPGLVGDVDIPKLSAGASAYWINNETTDTTESTPVLASVSLSPKTVSGRVDFSRKMMLQSAPSVEAIVRADLAAALATAIDLAGIHGAGTAEPVGIAQITSDAIAPPSGVGLVVGGTAGAAPTYAHILELWSKTAIANADFGSLAYITNPQVAAKLMQTPVVASTDSRMVMSEKDMLNGYRCFITNQVTSTVDKGGSTDVCSAILFGNWADMLIGLWGGLDIVPDSVTNGDRGGMVIRAFQDVDIAARHYQSFSVMGDALTA